MIETLQIALPLLDAAVWWFGLLGLLLVQYVILFKIYYAYHPGPYPIWTYFAVVAFGVQDVLLNLVLSLLFMDPPREFTITERMRRYKAENFGKSGIRKYRFLVADNLCKILNVFDRDGHC